MELANVPIWFRGAFAEWDRPALQTRRRKRRSMSSGSQPWWREDLLFEAVTCILLLSGYRWRADRAIRLPKSDECRHRTLCSIPYFGDLNIEIPIAQSQLLCQNLRPCHMSLTLSLPYLRLNCFPQSLAIDHHPSKTVCRYYKTGLFLHHLALAYPIVVDQSRAYSIVTSRNLTDPRSSSSDEISLKRKLRQRDCPICDRNHPATRHCEEKLCLRIPGDFGYLYLCDQDLAVLVVCYDLFSVKESPHAAIAGISLDCSG